MKIAADQPTMAASACKVWPSIRDADPARAGHAMPFGAAIVDGGVRFALWAPGVDSVGLELRRDAGTRGINMAPAGDGWFGAIVGDAGPGDCYRFVLPDGTKVPDPASRFNPQDVHGPSQIVDPNYSWKNDAWKGRPWSEAVIYELHVGTFSSEGTFQAAQQRLGELAALGVTAIELMPLADFPGKRNWGYDGVLPFAPDASYGTPEQLRALIDAAHGHQMMVLLDVVYNHFGPEGNYLPSYCPQFFNAAHQTPWGAAINFDGAHSRTVRDFFIHNALYWLEEFRFDGLRLDAVHAIRDDTELSIVKEICLAVQAGPDSARHVHVVLENEDNLASLLTRQDSKPTCATAQWNDDIHHAVHVLATGETEGYYKDYQRAPVELFARALAEGFVFQGQASRHLEGKRRGEPSGHLPNEAFISFLQTHDQIGNRALGERIHALGDQALLRAARACILLSPHIPMFFMGEEYAASTPFQFFCDFGPELAEAVTHGRREEFSHFGAFSGDAAASVPDPNAEATFLNSKLNWDERRHPPHVYWLEEAKALLSLRKEHIVPLLPFQRSGGHFHASDNNTIWIEWEFETTPPVRLRLVAHLGDASSLVVTPQGRVIYRAGTSPSGSMWMQLERGAVLVTLQDLP